MTSSGSPVAAPAVRRHPPTRPRPASAGRDLARPDSCIHQVCVVPDGREDDRHAGRPSRSSSRRSRPRPRYVGPRGERASVKPQNVDDEQGGPLAEARPPAEALLADRAPGGGDLLLDELAARHHVGLGERRLAAAARTRSGVSGSSLSSTPSAFETAFAIAPGGARAAPPPPSPAPLTPFGEVGARASKGAAPLRARASPPPSRRGSP